MASDLRGAVTTIQLNDYSALVVLTAVGYDYMLTFSKEVEYVWTKSWSRVSTLFVLVRYVGLYSIIGEFFPAWPYKDVCVYASPSCIDDNPLRLNITIGDALSLPQAWTTLLFFGASDLVAILRVWALYHRSRKILVVLLLLYAVEIVPYLIICAIDTWSFVPLGVARVSGLSFCTRLGGSKFWAYIIDSLQIVFGTSMCVLVGIQFFHQSVQMYRATNECRLDHYFNVLVKEGIIYFIAALMHSVINVFVTAGNIPVYEPWTVLLGALQVVPMFTLTPRFILNLRELYAHDLKHQLGSELDTGFGLGSQFGRETVTSAVLTHSGAQENEEREGLEQDGEIWTEESSKRRWGV